MRLASDGALLAIVEDATTAILTLTEDVERAELLRSRLTRLEVRRRVLAIASALADVSDELRDALPELDWAAWSFTALRVDGGACAEDEALWFAVRSLTPATLMWLRLCCDSQPAAFRN